MKDIFRVNSPFPQRQGTSEIMQSLTNESRFTRLACTYGEYAVILLAQQKLETETQREKTTIIIMHFLFFSTASFFIRFIASRVYIPYIIYYGIYIYIPYWVAISKLGKTDHLRLDQTVIKKNKKQGINHKKGIWYTSILLTWYFDVHNFKRLHHFTISH